ncbi:MAG: alpha-E domain-containing protein [Anaerolineales bacterium]|nr:alpha-E domain-containing protein [Anaerolineales bacterium]
MLSRVAESLFWMARYIERAEDLTRLLAVNFNALLEAQPDAVAQGWAPIVTVTGDDALFTELYGQPTAAAVIEFLLWNPLNPNAVVACVTRARENARSVREQVSSEMWERINRLYFKVKDADRAAVMRNPHEFSLVVRDGSQAFQGVTLTTMSHGEGYEFIRLGHHLERADKTTRILAAKYAYICRLPVVSSETSLQLIALLRSCSAFEPFRRGRGAALEIEPVAEYLLLDKQLPRAVLFCITRALQSLDIVSEGAPPRPEGARRILGRMRAELEYLDIADVLGEPMDAFLTDLLLRLNAAADEVARNYFNARVILPDSRPRQQQQQQQQQW